MTRRHCLSLILLWCIILVSVSRLCTPKEGPPAEGRGIGPAPARVSRLPTDLEQFRFAVWEHLTDQDRAEQLDIEAAYQAGKDSGDYSDWRRLIEAQLARQPWEIESREEQETRLRMGWHGTTNDLPDTTNAFFPPQ